MNSHVFFPSILDPEFVNSFEFGDEIYFFFKEVDKEFRCLEVSGLAILNYFSAIYIRKCNDGALTFG